MHSYWEAIVLGVVQGLTEFLPISSTAHLRIVPALLGWDDPGAAFSAVVQIGTLVAVIAYFWSDLVRIGGAWSRDAFSGRPLATLDARMGWMMIVGTVPIVVAGLLFKDAIEGRLRSLYCISAALSILAVVLIVAEWCVKRRQARGAVGKELHDVGWTDAVVVGLAQAVALIPGSSRSGVTITAGLFLGLTREAAARFSFLLSLPAIFTAGVYQLVKSRDVLLTSSDDLTRLLVSTAVAGVVGYASIAFLLRYLRTHTTWLFIGYRLALAAVLLALLLSDKLPAQ